MKRKIASLCLASALCLSLAVPAFAAEPAGNANVENGVVASYQVDENTEVVYLQDGTKLVFSVHQADSSPLTRAGSKFTAKATKQVSHNYNCVTADGDYASVTVGNVDEDDDEARMRVQIVVTVNDATIDRTKNLSVGEETDVVAYSETGKGLDCTFRTTIKPTNVNSVMYSYEALQSWRH